MLVFKRNTPRLITVLVLFVLLVSPAFAQNPVTVTIFVGLGTGDIARTV